MVTEVHNGGRDGELFIVLAASRASSMAKTKTMTSSLVLSRRNGMWAGLSCGVVMLLGWCWAWFLGCCGKVRSGKPFSFFFYVFIFYCVFSVLI
jgi:hypothetical protein